jgi:hypothetical protein
MTGEEGNGNSLVEMTRNGSEALAVNRGKVSPPNYPARVVIAVSWVNSGS